MAKSNQDGRIWSLVIKKKRVGPLTEEEVRDRFLQGQVTVRTYAWRKGMKLWIRLGNIPEYGDLLVTAGGEPPPIEDEPTPIKKKASTQPLFKISSPEDVEHLLHKPVPQDEPVIREDSSTDVRWDGSAPTIPADASVPAVETIPVETPPAEGVVELSGGVDPNAETTRWDQEQVEQAIREGLGPDAEGAQGPPSTSQEMRLTDDIDQLFGRPAPQPEEPTPAPEPKSASGVVYESLEQPEPEPEPELELEPEPEPEPEPELEPEPEPEPELEPEPEPELEPEEPSAPEHLDSDFDFVPTPIQGTEEEEEEPPSPDPKEETFTTDQGLVGARAKDSVLFSRTQFDMLARQMSGEDFDVDEPSLHDIQPLAQQALEQPGVPEEVLRAGRRHPDALLLGSVLPDLPFHARFLGQLVRHLSGREYIYSQWGHVFHTRRTGNLALSLLAHLGREHPEPEEADRQLAMAAGYICHHAVDRLNHPVVQAAVGANLEPGTPHLVLHSRIERYQNILYHKDLLGHEIPGTPFARELLAQSAGTGLVRARLDEVLWRTFRAACLETHGRCPTRRETEEWLWGITAYGAVFSSPMGRRERLEHPEQEIRDRWYSGDRVDLESPLSASLKLTVRCWGAAAELVRADWITAELRRFFLDAVPNIDLETGY